MKFTASVSALTAALGHVQRVVERRNTIPVLANVLLRANSGALTLQATDLDIQVTNELAVDVEKAGATTVPAHLLYDILRKMPAEAEASFEVADGAALAIKSGRSRFKLNVLPIEDFPDLTEGDYQTTFAMKATALLDLIDDVAFAISTEETRYYLNGIYLHHVMMGNRPVMRVVSTDGHRLAQSQIDAPMGGEKFTGVIVPRKTAGEMQKILSGAKKEDEITIQISNTKVRFSYGSTVLVSKLIDGTFPDYARVIPQGNDKRLVLDCAAFRASVDRVGAVSSERGRGIKLEAKDNRVIFSVNSPDSGSATDEIEGKYDSDPIEIGFNSKYLLDMAAQLKGESVHFMFADPGSPTLIRGDGSEDRLFVLMPMRV
jgi:DNA polymerase-3 subunit beta